MDSSYSSNKNKEKIAFDGCTLSIDRRATVVPSRTFWLYDAEENFDDWMEVKLMLIWWWHGSVPGILYRALCRWPFHWYHCIWYHLVHSGSAAALFFGPRIRSVYQENQTILWLYIVSPTCPDLPLLCDEQLQLTFERTTTQKWNGPLFLPYIVIFWDINMSADARRVSQYHCLFSSIKPVMLLLFQLYVAK